MWPQSVRVGSTGDRWPVHPFPPSVNAVHEILAADSQTLPVRVVSVSVDGTWERSRFELGLNDGRCQDPTALATKAARLLRGSFGDRVGSLRIDVYQCNETWDSCVLVGTHGDLTD
jgi:hypothetical protein